MQRERERWGVRDKPTLNYILHRHGFEEMSSKMHEFYYVLMKIMYSQPKDTNICFECCTVLNNRVPHYYYDCYCQMYIFAQPPTCVHCISQSRQQTEQKFRRATTTPTTFSSKNLSILICVVAMCLSPILMHKSFFFSRSCHLYDVAIQKKVASEPKNGTPEPN